MFKNRQIANELVRRRRYRQILGWSSLLTVLALAFTPLIAELNHHHGLDSESCDYCPIHRFYLALNAATISVVCVGIVWDFGVFISLFVPILGFSSQLFAPTRPRAPPES